MENKKWTSTCGIHSFVHSFGMISFPSCVYLTLQLIWYDWNWPLLTTEVVFNHLTNNEKCLPDTLSCVKCKRHHSKSTQYTTVEQQLNNFVLFVTSNIIAVCLSWFYITLSIVMGDDDDLVIIYAALPFVVASVDADIMGETFFSGILWSHITHPLILVGDTQ